MIDNKKIIDQLYDDCYRLSDEISENVGNYWDDDLRRAYDKLMETIDIISINVLANIPRETALYVVNLALYGLEKIKRSMNIRDVDTLLLLMLDIREQIERMK